MHQVRPVEDDQLPATSPWAFVTVGGDTYLLIARSRFANPEGLCRILGTAWEAWRSLGATAVVPVAVPLMPLAV